MLHSPQRTDRGVRQLAGLTIRLSISTPLLAQHPDRIHSYLAQPALGNRDRNKRAQNKLRGPYATKSTVRKERHIKKEGEIHSILACTPCTSLYILRQKTMLVSYSYKGAKKGLLWHKKVFLRQRGEKAKKQDNWIQLLQICNRSQQFKENRDSHQGKLQTTGKTTPPLPFRLYSPI